MKGKVIMAANKPVLVGDKLFRAVRTGIPYLDSESSDISMLYVDIVHDEMESCLCETPGHVPFGACSEYVEALELIIFYGGLEGSGFHARTSGRTVVFDVVSNK